MKLIKVQIQIFPVEKAQPQTHSTPEPCTGSWEEIYWKKCRKQAANSTDA